MNRKIITALTILLLGAYSAGAQRFDRGYDNSTPTLFAPKGCFMVGGNARFTWHSMNNYSFLIADGINSNGYTVSAKPTFLYMFRDNMGVGASFSYDRTNLDLDSAQLGVSDITMSVDDYFHVAQSFGGSLIFRPYIPLGSSGRFSMFAEVGVGFSVGKAKNTVNLTDGVKGTYTERYKILVGVNPGFTAFISNHLAMELSVGVLGFNYKWSNQVHNQVSKGSSDASNASFMINLASISVGLAYYL